MINQTIESRIVTYNMECDIFVGDLVESPEVKRQMEIKIIISHCGYTD